MRRQREGAAWEISRHRIASMRDEAREEGTLCRCGPWPGTTAALLSYGLIRTCHSSLAAVPLKAPLACSQLSLSLSLARGYLVSTHTRAADSLAHAGRGWVAQQFS